MIKKKKVNKKSVLFLKEGDLFSLKGRRKTRYYSFWRFKSDASLEDICASEGGFIDCRADLEGYTVKAGTTLMYMGHSEEVPDGILFYEPQASQWIGTHEDNFISLFFKKLI
jgi:hypothetical protein